MTKPKKLVSGDIFWYKYNGKYFFARILLDFNTVSKRADVKDNAFRSFITNASYYFEIYSIINDEPTLSNRNVLFSGWVFSSAFNPKNFEWEDWGFYSNDPVKPELVDFPEYIFGRDNKFLGLQKGELLLETKISSEYFSKFDFPGPMCYSNFEGVVTQALAEMERRELIKREYLDGIELSQILKLDRFDLRFNKPLRDEIYNSLQIDPNISYYDLSLRNGKDIRRFFTNI